jgi:hypothetical protein
MQAFIRPLDGMNQREAAVPDVRAFTRPLGGTL